MNLTPVDPRVAATRGSGSTPEIPSRSSSQGLEVIISDQGVEAGHQPDLVPEVTTASAAPVWQGDLGLYTGRGMAATMPAEGLQGQLLDVTG